MRQTTTGRWATQWAAVALLLAGTTTFAQTAPPVNAVPDPADPRAAVPPVLHRSVLVNSPAPTDDVRIDWREANEAVNRIGGWRAYARQAQQPDPVAPAPGGHTGHGGPGNQVRQ